jgi:CMP-2-keto-3-deoxyoctulosonic acid synthetase
VHAVRWNSLKSVAAAVQKCSLATEPWLILDFLVTDRTSSTGAAFTSEETAELQRTVWERAEAVIAKARGDEPATARETLRQLIDEVAVFSSALVTAPMPERQATEWRLAAEEIAGLAAAALAKAGSTSGGE